MGRKAQSAKAFRLSRHFSLFDYFERTSFKGLQTGIDSICSIYSLQGFFKVIIAMALAAVVTCFTSVVVTLMSQAP